jgi:hypothetical protein
MILDESYKRILHRLDYYNYQHGLIVRHLNQGTGWDSHLEKCRSFILKAIEKYHPDTVTILGSGWLLEVPLKEITEIAGRVNLVDIVHPAEVIQQTKGMPSVNLFTDDVTGGLIDKIWKKTSAVPFLRKLKSLENFEIPEYTPDYEPGLIISLNLLSQLDVLPVRYLQRKSAIKDTGLMTLRGEIQMKHLDFLKKHKSVLITDISEIFSDNHGIKEEEKTVVIDLPVGNYSEEWIWDFDVAGYDFNLKRSVLKMVGIIL